VSQSFDIKRYKDLKSLLFSVAIFLIGGLLALATDSIEVFHSLMAIGFGICSGGIIGLYLRERNHLRNK
jgi:hypothetical protein